MAVHQVITAIYLSRIMEMILREMRIHEEVSPCDATNALEPIVKFAISNAALKLPYALGTPVIFMSSSTATKLDKDTMTALVVIQCAKMLLGVNSEIDMLTHDVDQNRPQQLRTEILMYVCSLFGKDRIIDAFTRMHLFAAQRDLEYCAQNKISAKDHYVKKVRGDEWLDRRLKQLDDLYSRTDTAPLTQEVEKVIQLNNFTLAKEIIKDRLSVTQFKITQPQE